MARLGGGGGAAKEKAPRPVKAAKTAQVRPVAKAKPSGGAFVGLDIGTSAIKAVEVKGAGAGLTVTAVATINTPPGLIQNGMVMDAKALGAAVKQLLSRNGLRSGKVVLAASGTDSVVVRVIEVPKMTPTELAETMKWEVERHIPFSVNDVEMAYQPLDPPGAVEDDPNNPNMEVLLAVARRDLVATQIDTANAAGLNPVAIDIETLAAGRALIDLSVGRGMTSKNVVVVNIGASNTDVGIYKNGVLRFPRSIPVAGDSFTRAIADHLNLTMDAAEDEKRQNAVVLMEFVGVAAQETFGGNDNNPFTFDDASVTIPPPLFPGPAPIVETPPPVLETAAVADTLETPGVTDNTPPSPFDLPMGTAEDPFATPAVSAEANPFDPFGNSAGTTGDTFVSSPSAVPAADDPLARRRREIFDALLPVLGELSMEIRRSIDYFRSRYPSETVDQILLCGGSARIGNLSAYFQQDLGIAASVADPFAGLKVVSKQMSAQALADSAPAYAVALGLAARDAVIGSGR